jgi:hypothetical protein
MPVKSNCSKLSPDESNDLIRIIIGEEYAVLDEGLALIVSSTARPASSKPRTRVVPYLKFRLHPLRSRKDTHAKLKLVVDVVRAGPLYLKYRNKGTRTS